MSACSYIYIFFFIFIFHHYNWQKGNTVRPKCLGPHTTDGDVPGGWRRPRAPQELAKWHGGVHVGKPTLTGAALYFGDEHCITKLSECDERNIPILRVT